MKHALLTIGSLLGALCLGQASALADTIVSVTETHYDANLRPDCVAVRMNALTFADAPSNACTPKTSVGGNGPDHITQTVYDNAGQVKAIYRGVGTSSIIQYAYYDYTPNGMKSLEIDASHNKTTFTYDGFDRLSKVQYPITMTGQEASSATDYESFGYDANGNRTSWRRRDGNTIAYSFDALNRQTYEGGDAVADMTTAYDLQGHILAKHFTSGNIGVDYAYDGLGRVLSTTDMNGRMVTYGYNSASARTGMIYPDGNNLIYALDTLNRVGNIHWTDGTVMVWQGYNNLGQRRVLDRGAVSGSGGSTAYTYDNFGRLTGLAINMDGASTAHDMSWSFVYNPANQLANWTSTGATYDYVEAATSSTSKTYDGLNRDATIAAVSGGYDTKGNVTKDASRVMTYDIYNRLLTIASLATPTTPYMRLVYDPEGRLSSVTTSGGTKEFLYDGTNLIGEYLHVGASTTVHTCDTMTDRYVNGTGTDEPVVWYSGATLTAPRFLFANYQGSVIAYTTTAGAFSESYAYDPYGVPVNSTGGTSWFGSRFRYTGQIALPEAGVYYYKARIYDPIAGRFLQTDPVGSADDIDLYTYVGADPVNNSDPTGLYTCEDKRRCRDLEADLQTLRTASQDKSLSKEQRSMLTNVVNAYGAAGEKNGVDVRFASLGKTADGGGDIGGSTVRNRNGTFTITMSSEMYSRVRGQGPLLTSTIERDEVIVHESSHVYWRKNHSYTLNAEGFPNRNQVHDNEVYAYTNQKIFLDMMGHGKGFDINNRANASTTQDCHESQLDPSPNSCY